MNFTDSVPEFESGELTCVITDAVMELSIDHTWMGDVSVTLLSEDGQGTMFGGICGSTDDWRGFLDDKSANAVTTRCGQANTGGDARTQSGSGLSGLNGTDPRGDWTLRIADTVGGDSGTLEKAVLKLKVGELVAP